MIPSPLLDSTGRPVPLAGKLAGGGEGVVYTLPNDPATVVKVYFPERRTAQIADKLKAAIGMAPPPAS